MTGLDRWRGRGSSATRWVRRGVVGGLLVVLGVAPLLATPFWLTLGTSVVILAVAVVGLNVVTGLGGMLDLGHACYFGLAAYLTVSHAHAHGGDALVGMLVGVGAATIAGLLVALLFQRLEGLAFALATLSLAFLAQAVAGTFFDSGTGVLGVTGPARTIFGQRNLTAEGLYVAAVVALASASAGFWWLRRSAFGRALALARHHRGAAEACGIATTRLRTLTFVLGAAITGVAGSLSGAFLRFAGPDSIGAAKGLELLSVAVIGGLGSLYGPLLGALIVTGIPEALQPLADYQMLITGSAFLLVLFRQARPRRPGRWPVPADHRARAVADAPPPARSDPPAVIKAAADAPLLDAEGMVKRFGGVVAVDGASLRVLPGQIHGLVGPNGSGKSTLIDLLTGLQRADAGRLRLGGAEITSRAAHRRARLGLHRTFQLGSLTPLLSVGANVALGAWTSPDPDAEARRALALLGVGTSVDAAPGSLATAARRLAEVARAVAGSPRLVVLDEPAAGLDEEAREVLVRAIRAVRDRGAAVLLVEHDVDLVLEVSDVVTVMDAGAVVATGPPAVVVADPVARTAYFGDALHQAGAVS